MDEIMKDKLSTNELTSLHNRWYFLYLLYCSRMLVDFDVHLLS